ncbi:hypothetical protein AB1N83_007044, partial [Pleurotus pulmonarius]
SSGAPSLLSLPLSPRIVLQP